MLEEISDIPLRPSALDNPAVKATLGALDLPAGRISRAQLAVATLFLVNGAAIGSWVPHIPERAHAL